MFFDNDTLTRICSIEHDIAYRTELPEKPTHPNHPTEPADSQILAQYKRDCDLFIMQITQYDKQIDEDCQLLKKQLSMWQELIVELAHLSTTPSSKNRKDLNILFEQTVNTKDVFAEISSRCHDGISILIDKRELFLSKILQ